MATLRAPPPPRDPDVTQVRPGGQTFIHDLKLMLRPQTALSPVSPPRRARRNSESESSEVISAERVQVARRPKALDSTIRSYRSPGRRALARVRVRTFGINFSHAVATLERENSIF